MKILVFMSDNRNLLNNKNECEYNSLTACINYLYCKKHNYSFIYYQPYIKGESFYNCINFQTNSKRHPAWSKLLSTYSTLNDNEHYDYIVYIDSDCIFKDFNKPLENIIDKNFDMIFLRDNEKNLPCSGFYILKKNQQNKDNIMVWYNINAGKYDTEHSWEQQPLHKIFENFNIKILDMEMFDEEQGQFLRHITHFNNDIRKPYFLNFMIENNININKINDIKTIKYDTIIFRNDFFSESLYHKRMMDKIQRIYTKM
jgi:hypothetical protein